MKTTVGKAWSDHCLRACLRCIVNSIPDCTHKNCEKCTVKICEHECHQASPSPAPVEAG